MSEQETPKAIAAFREYCLLGMDRSLVKLKAHVDQIKPKSSPSLATLKLWSAQHDWVARASKYDEEQSRQLEQTIAAERAKVLTSRYALMHKRIEALDKLAAKLEAYMEDEQNIWLPDVKGIGTGPTAERVDLIRFNDALISEYRATFADIAAEMGERVKKSEITGAGGGPLTVGGQVGFYPVQLPQKEESEGARVELPEKGGDAHANANTSESDEHADRISSH